MRILEQHPAFGYVGALFAALPPWALDLREWIGIAGALLGLAIGVLTFAIQVRTWRRK